MASMMAAAARISQPAGPWRASVAARSPNSWYQKNPAVASSAAATAPFTML